VTMRASRNAILRSMTACRTETGVRIAPVNGTLALVGRPREHPKLDRSHDATGPIYEQERR
jgi:hypothetical protein